jgi:hypothetical protein
MEPEVKVPDEKQKEKIMAAYKTQKSSPCLFVHPNPKVKSGKFDCRVESLSVLLDYRSGSSDLVLSGRVFYSVFLICVRFT